MQNFILAILAVITFVTFRWFRYKEMKHHRRAVTGGKGDDIQAFQKFAILKAVAVVCLWLEAVIFIFLNE